MSHLHWHRGHSDEFSYELMASDVNDFIKSHNLGEVTIIGHSMGGKTAMQVAFSYPEVVKRLIVIDISPISSGGKENAEVISVINGLKAIKGDIVLSRRQADERFSLFVKNFEVRQFNYGSSPN